MKTRDIATMREWEQKREKLLNELGISFVELMVREGWFRSCLNCEFWQDKEEVCRKWKVRPPAKVIVTGCEDHSDEIPF